MKRPILFVILSTILITAFAVGAQIVSTNNNLLTGGNGSLNSLTLTTPLAPTSGGVGAMTGAPEWARYFGNGINSTGPASGTIANTGETQYTSWHCTGAITMTGSNLPLIVRSQGTINLDTGCTIIMNSSSGNLQGDMGGGGGSGGSEGATNSTVGKSSAYYNTTNGTPTTSNAISVGGAVSSSSIGNDATAINATVATMMFSMGPPVPSLGASVGSAGANTGGAGGLARAEVILIAPTITIASGVIINTSGLEGTDAAALLKGGGGGGGGAVIYLISEVFTDNGGIYKYGGGPGGNCTAPSINATGGGCDTTGCGKDAAFTVTGVTTGGLDATKITITNAGSGYKVAPDCTVNANGSGLVGSPACHFTLSGGTIASVVIDTAGTTATFADYSASCDRGGQGAPGIYVQQLMQ